MRLTPAWADGVFARFDRRLSRETSAPLALAVSGGGDSMALLLIAAQWAAHYGRRLLVLSVDHGLNRDGPSWNNFVCQAAESLGADWQGLIWCGEKPVSGLQAAARTARHELIADASRLAGARVILMAHTLDDVAEGDWMRHQGAPLGRLCEWSPSPVWPRGRELMLFRPLLGVRRAALRSWLKGLGQDWIEDPANDDPRFLRVQARRSQPQPQPQPQPASDLAIRATPNLDLHVNGDTGEISGPLASPWLSQALVCASGRSVIPAPAAVERLRARMTEGARRASQAGALIESIPGGARLVREPGRHPPQAMKLRPGAVQIWDGRFSVMAHEPGWTVCPAAGYRRRLSEQDRRRLKGLPASVRSSHPVLFREGVGSPVLADEKVELTCLVRLRLHLATGQIQTEADFAAAMESSRQDAYLQA